MRKNNQAVSAIIYTTLHYKILSAGIVLSVIGAVVTSLLPPLVLAEIINRLAGGSDISFHQVLLYFLLLVFAGLFSSVQESLLIIYGQKITHELRRRLSDKLTRLRADDLYKQDPGAVVSRFVGDVNTVETLFTSGIISMFADVCKIISILIIIQTQNCGLALLLLLVLPFVFLFTRIIQKKMLSAQLANRIAVGKVTNHVPESIRCIRMIHTLRKEAYMEERYDQFIGQSYAAVEKSNFFDAVYSPVILILNAVIAAVVMLLASSGNSAVLSFFGMSVGTSVAVINYISQVFSPIESLGMEIQTIQSAVAGVHRINDFLSLPEREMLTSVFQPDPKACCIEFQNVDFGYGDHCVLKNMNFSIHPSEQIILAGRTGAGKSTIFKLILGLYKPEAGNVLINGTEASQIPDHQKRTIFGYVEQSFHQIPGTIRDQITLYDTEITAEMTEKAAEIVGLHECICSFPNGYDTPCTPGLFSQGQWQLLSIARAIAGDPNILLLDEITANLDADTEQTVLQVLHKISSDKTVVSISHRLNDHSDCRIIHI